MAQDTGGAIKGGVRADFFWGFGKEAGEQAGQFGQEPGEPRGRSRRDHPALGLPSATLGRSQLPEAGHLRRKRRQGVELPAVGIPPDLQHQREGEVRDEREGVRRVDGQRGQDREQLGEIGRAHV